LIDAIIEPYNIFSLRHIDYGIEAETSTLEDFIECPVQTDTSKYQRKDCSLQLLFRTQLPLSNISLVFYSNTNEIMNFLRNKYLLKEIKLIQR